MQPDQILPVSAAVRRLQLAMVSVYVAVEIGDDTHCGAQREFDAALDVLIERPPADTEEAAARLRCLAQIGETYLEDTWTASKVHAAMRTVASGLLHPRRDDMRGVDGDRICCDIIEQICPVG